MRCQVCGKIVKKPYYWNDNPKIPIHKNLKLCGDQQLFADFLNRNIEYVNRRGPFVPLT